MYQKDDHIVFHGAPNSAKTPDGAEAIYAEPFGHIGGKNVQSTALAPLENAPGYQNLQGKKLESGKIIERFYLISSNNITVKQTVNENGENDQWMHGMLSDEPLNSRN